jgi:hypothetical protein
VSLITCLASIGAQEAWSRGQSDRSGERIAVLEFKNYANARVPEMMYLSDQARREAAQLLGDRFVIMTRETLNTLVESPEVVEACIGGCEVELGRTLQAHWIVTGTVVTLGDRLHATLKLHEVKRGNLVGIEDAYGDDMEGLSTSVKSATGRLLSHLLNLSDGVKIPQINLGDVELPEGFELKPLKRFGMPIHLLKAYDETLELDENPKAEIEAKISAWSKMMTYKKAPQIQAQARLRIAYWNARYQRKLECQKNWDQLRMLLSMKRVISKDEKRKLCVDYLDACGRDPHENPAVSHPSIREILKEEAEAVALSASKRRRYRDQMSALDTIIGGSFAPSRLGFGTHVRWRIQPLDLFGRRLFTDMHLSVFDSQFDPDQFDLIGNEWGGSIGLQWLNETSIIPWGSVGYLNSGGHSMLSGELGLRRELSSGWLSLHFSLQYLYPLSEAPSTIGADGELRATLWAGTGLKGLLLSLFLYYIVATVVSEG